MTPQNKGAPSEVAVGTEGPGDDSRRMDPDNDLTREDDHEVEVMQRFACTGARRLVVSDDFGAVGVVLEVMHAPGRGIELLMPVAAAQDLMLVLQLGIEKAHAAGQSGFGEIEG